MKLSARHRLSAGILACAAFLCAACEESPSYSDARLEKAFRNHATIFAELLSMADHDHFEVLWIRTHEMQPSDMMLPDQRWRDYDRLCRTIHVSRVEHIANGLELDVGFDSVNFTHGSAKGYVFSRKQLPTVPSLDEGVPEADKREGWGIAYRMLGAGWYLFVRED